MLAHPQQTHFLADGPAPESVREPAELGQVGRWLASGGQCVRRGDAGALRQLLRGRVRGVRGQVRRDRGDERVRQPGRPPRGQRVHQVPERGGCGEGGE